MRPPSKPRGAPPLDALRALSPSAARAALLARGVGLSEGEVAQVLAQLTDRTEAGEPKPRRGRLEVHADEAPLRAGAHAGDQDGAAFEEAIDWLAASLFVDR